MELADGFGHPQDFVFCGLPHEEEGQGVTGEVEEALPVPGGIGLLTVAMLMKNTVIAAKMRRGIAEN